jgi:putative membrane protein
MDIGILKSLHIIFVVTWFAGLFYIFRLFVYHAEAQSKDEPERSILTKQYKLMEKRLWYIITWPSAILTLFFGTLLLIEMPGYLSESFMQLKLTFVAILYIYQVYGEYVIRQLKNDVSPFKSMTFRLLNEVPTIILIAVVFLIVKRNTISWIWGTIGILGVGMALAIAAKMYKKYRLKKKE